LSDERPEQIGDYMESITGVLAPAAISEWLKKVAERAGEICPEAHIEFRPGGDFGDIAFPNDARNCVIESLKEHEKQAPDLMRAILASYRAALERQ
jgi:hypothetical protein